MFEQEESKHAKRARLARELAEWTAKGGRVNEESQRVLAERERQGDMAWEARCRQALEPSW